MKSRKHFNHCKKIAIAIAMSFTPFPCLFLFKLYSTFLFIYFTSVLAFVPAGTEV